MKNVPFSNFQKEIINFVEIGIWNAKYRFEPNAQALGFGNEIQGIVAGIVYHNYQPENKSIELSAYSLCQKWFTKHNLNVTMQYPFNQLGLRLIHAQFSMNNEKSKRLFKALGASLVSLPDFYQDGENAVIAILKKQDWENSRYFDKGSYGKEFS